MTSSPAPVSDAPTSWDPTGERGLAEGICSLLVDGRQPAPELLALGEPNHREPVFPRLRNRLLELLVARGFRSIAVESDAVAALQVDRFVRGGKGTLDAAMATGFSHGFGELTANRELVAWLRATNDTRPAEEKVAFYGFDASTEMFSAPSPRHYLEQVHTYLTEHAGADAAQHSWDEIERLLGDDEPWSATDAVMHAERSPGSSNEAVGLRVIADDLATALHAHAPALVTASSPDAWHGADVHARAALGLLRYHAQCAHSGPQDERWARMSLLRDALMAQNLLALRTSEQHRGPTLAFANNRHLQRHPSTMRLGELNIEWTSAGAIVAALLGERYALALGALGTSTAIGLQPPHAGTYEAALELLTGGNGVVGSPSLRDLAQQELEQRDDVTGAQGHFALEAADLADADAVAYVAAPLNRPSDVEPPTPESLAARILTSLPDVTHLRADEASGAPEIAWGDWFFFAGGNKHRPFVTIVGRDVPGFDQASHLDRDGVFRLNIGLGRAGFQRELGFPPADLPHQEANIDFAGLDTLVPHPAYGGQGFVSILNPTAATLPDLDRLLADAHRRALPGTAGGPSESL